MRGVHACTVSAEVVEFEALRDRTYVEFVQTTVSERQASSYLKDPMPVLIAGSLPDPTARLSVDGVLDRRLPAVVTHDVAHVGAGDSSGSLKVPLGDGGDGAAAAHAQAAGIRPRSCGHYFVSFAR
jgi:hypothetical protein